MPPLPHPIIQQPTQKSSTSDSQVAFIKDSDPNRKITTSLNMSTFHPNVNMGGPPPNLLPPPPPPPISGKRKISFVLFI